MNRAWIPVLLTICLTVAACENAAPAPQEPAYFTEVANEEEAILLSWSVDQTEISTAARIQVRAQFTTPLGSGARFSPVDWEGAGWIVASDREAPPRVIDSGLLLAERTWLLEPFLDGQLEIPPLVVTWGEENLRTLQAAGTMVSVTPFLTEADSLELAPPIEPTIPGLRTPGHLWKICALVLGGIVTVSLYLLARPNKLDNSSVEPPESVVRRLASSQQPASTLLPELHRALDELARARPEVFGGLLACIERERFGDQPASTTVLFERALELVESDEGSRA